MENEELTANDHKDDKVTKEQEKEATITDVKTVNIEEISEKIDINSEDSSSVEELFGNEGSDKIKNNVLVEEQNDKSKNEECSKSGEQGTDSEKVDENIASSDLTVCAASNEKEPMDSSEKISIAAENDGGIEQSEYPGEKFYTPPLPAPEDCDEESNNLDEQDKCNTPTRTAFTKPIVLFTPTDDESEETQAYCSTEILTKLDDDLEKNSMVSNVEQVKENVPETSEKEEDIVVECDDESQVKQLTLDVGKEFVIHTV
jgi:hypothetical protein